MKWKWTEFWGEKEWTDEAKVNGRYGQNMVQCKTSESDLTARRAKIQKWVKKPNASNKPIRKSAREVQTKADTTNTVKIKYRNENMDNEKNDKQNLMWKIVLMV